MFKLFPAVSILIIAGACSTAAETPTLSTQAPAASSSVPSTEQVTDAGSVQSQDATQPEMDAGTNVETDFFAKLNGLWSGPVTDTTLGSFPLTNMDFRAASDSVLFGRVDLDDKNSLRFAFAVELNKGRPTLIFRNGGLFQGLSRDTRTELVEHANSHYKFCSIASGCSYLQADLTFSSATSLELRVAVKGILHELWTAKRVEARQLPVGFPVHTNLSINDDFPSMPTAKIRVSWATPLTMATDVWAILSTTSCIPPSSCQFSRWVKSRAAAGATSATIRIDQIHSGDYAVLGVVDSNNNLATTRFADHGDLITASSPTIHLPLGATTTSVNAVANFLFP